MVSRSHHANYSQRPQTDPSGIDKFFSQTDPSGIDNDHTKVIAGLIFVQLFTARERG